MEDVMSVEWHLITAIFISLLAIWVLTIEIRMGRNR